MKKIFSLFAIAAMMIGMVACTDDDDIVVHFLSSLYKMQSEKRL